MESEQNAVSSGGDAPSFEIEVEAPGLDDAASAASTPGDAGSQGLSPPLAAGSSPDPVSSLRSEIDDLRRQNAQLVGELTPFVMHLRNQQQAATQRPPITREELDTNPNLTPSDLIRYMEWQQQQSMGQTAAQLEASTRTMLAQERARGEFSAATMGEGQDYDSLTNRYVAPLVQNNPAIRELIRYAAPGDPARGEMIFATVCALIDRCGDDVVGGLRAALDGVGAYKRGATATTQKITQAAAAQADRVFAGRAPAATKKLDAAAMWSLPDDQFRALMGRAQ